MPQERILSNLVKIRIARRRMAAATRAATSTHRIFVVPPRPRFPVIGDANAALRIGRRLLDHPLLGSADKARVREILARLGVSDGR